MTLADIAVILRRLDEQDKTLEEIKTHAERTNGRVTGLELWRARLEGAKGALSWVQPLAIALVTGGAIAGLSALFG